MPTLDVLSKILSLVLTAVLGFLTWQGQMVLSELNEHDKRLARIEANRYTSSDAISDQRMITAEVRQLRTWVEDNFPPSWLREDISELRNDVRMLRDELHKQRSN